MTRYSDNLGIPAQPIPPGTCPGGWRLEVRYPGGPLEYVDLGPDCTNVAGIAERHAAGGATVIVYDGDTGQPHLAIGVMQL
jgi:hypothetical protein